MSDYHNADMPIVVQGLHRRFGANAVLAGIDLEIPRGVVYGLVGENGVGKTTLIRHLLGLLKAQQGRVEVFGLNPVRNPVGVLSRIGYLSEDRDLPAWMRVAELLDYSAAFYSNWDTDYAEELRGAFELDEKSKLGQLSQGQRARAGMLVALAHRPELLVLDEPSTGLDPIVRRDILTAIIRTIADEGRTVLFSSHLLDEVERVADRVGILADGKIILDGQLDELRDSHHELVLRFSDTRLDAPEISGLLSAELVGAEWLVVCAGDFARISSEVAGMGGQVVRQRMPTLNDIFVARVGRSQQRTDQAAA